LYAFFDFLTYFLCCSTPREDRERREKREKKKRGRGGRKEEPRPLFLSLVSSAWEDGEKKRERRGGKKKKRSVAPAFNRGKSRFYHVFDRAIREGAEKKKKKKGRGGKGRKT